MFFYKIIIFFIFFKYFKNINLKLFNINDILLLIKIKYLFMEKN